jgi:hypothetical protein
MLLHVREHCSLLNPSNTRRLRAAAKRGDEQNLLASASQTFAPAPPPLFCAVVAILSRILTILFVLVSALANHAPGAPLQNVLSLFKGTIESFKLNSMLPSSTSVLDNACDTPSSSMICSGKLVSSFSATDVKSKGFDFSNWFNAKKKTQKKSAERRKKRLIFLF